MNGEWYFFGENGRMIKHDFHWKSRICVEISGKKVWFKEEDYVKYLENFIKYYRKHRKK